MVDGLICVAPMDQQLSRVKDGVDPKSFLIENYIELLKERVIIDANGKEIGTRLKDLVGKASEAARENQKTDQQESFARAVVRNALRILSFSFCENTPGGIPTGPAYERSIPDTIKASQFGHEKVGYPMSDYQRLSFLPVGNLGTPLCDADYSTCYVKEGMMIQDKPIRRETVTVTLEGAKKPISFDLANAAGEYHALFPFSERTYDLVIPFSVQQYSPFIPGNYEASGLPVEIIEITAENPTDKAITVIYTLTQENILGWYPKAAKEDPKNPHTTLLWKKDSKGNLATAYKQDNTAGLLFTKAVNQEDFVRIGSGIAGQIAIASNETQNVKVKVDSKTGALTLTIILQPGEKVSHPITVAYDTPFYNFQYKATDPNSPGVRMPKFYTRIYGETGQNAQKMAADALKNRLTWKEQIVKFQKSITDDPSLPDFFKQALLNELYVLPETGIWEADQGRFAYLESIDYKMYNTSDVNSYTSALLLLFPELERKDLLEFAKMVPLSVPRRQWWGTDRWAHIPPPQWRHLYHAPVKDEGAVCHDLGGLLGAGNFPFTNTCNEFDWSNANMWIDLAPKFALRVWRYYTFMQKQAGIDNKDFIKQVYPSVKLALDTLERRWGDKVTHIPVSKGVPDWTYDTISGTGYTPNVTTQWLAALQAAVRMALIVGDTDSLGKYSLWLDAGKPVMGKLWNPKGYFNAFVSPDGSKINDLIHSDMLFGDFYARMTGLPPIASNEQASQSLETIYRVNGEGWSKVGDHGPLGLVNLRGPNGEQNKTEQGDEGWTGTMLLNAAYQIKVGRETGNQKLAQNGWQIIQGFYNVVYSQSPDSQHWFGRTPEGYVNPDDIRYDDKEEKKKYGIETGRAPKYMRALAIWSVYAALKEKLPFDFLGRQIPDRPDTFPLPFGKTEQKK